MLIRLPRPKSIITWRFYFWYFRDRYCSLCSPQLCWGLNGRSVKNVSLLKGLVCALLHLKPDRVQSIEVLNPYEPSEDILDKNFILDVKICLNNKTVVNIELQVQPQKYWNNRSLTYLCRLFDNLKKGASYSDVMPAYHIGILDFTLFPNTLSFMPPIR